MSGETPQSDRLMGHGADNDGIEEYDNPLPDWWLGLFFFTVLWAVGYGVDYHLVSGRSQAASYVAEVEAADRQWPAVTAVAAEATPEVIQDGRAIFQQNCIACHGEHLEGGIGPNLIDETWIHGGTLAEIQTTIANGVPEKGMLNWGPILGPEKVSKVAAYVYATGLVDGS